MIAYKKFSYLTKEQLKLLEDIHFDHWSKISPKMVYEDTVKKFENYALNDDIPFGIAMFLDDEIIGFSIIRNIDLEEYSDEFHPWLSDVMILKDYRNKGYGKQMVENTYSIFKDMGYDRFYLWTDQAPVFYEKLGFQLVKFIEKDDGKLANLYRKYI